MAVAWLASACGWWTPADGGTTVLVLQLMDLNLILPGGAIVADNTLMKVGWLFSAAVSVDSPTPCLRPSWRDGPAVHSPQPIADRHPNMPAAGQGIRAWRREG